MPSKTATIQTITQLPAHITRRKIEQRDIDFIVQHELEVYSSGDDEHNNNNKNSNNSNNNGNKASSSMQEQAKNLRKIISGWYFSKHSEVFRNFAWIYESNATKQIVAVWLVMPMNSYAYKDLILGKRKELEITEADFFAPGPALTVAHVGLHVYHIGKYGNEIHQLSSIFLHEMARVLQILMKQYEISIQPIGLSGYCVSPTGIATFKRFGCVERKEFVSREYVLYRDTQDKNKVTHRETKTVQIKVNGAADSNQKVQQALDQYKQQGGWQLLNKCQMMITFAGENSPAWNVIPATGSQYFVHSSL